MDRASGDDFRTTSAWRARAVRAAMAGLLGLTAPLTSAAPGAAYAELSGGFKSGDFGTATRSDLYYLAPAAGYVTPDLDLSVTVPYLRLTTETGGVSGTEAGLGDILARGGASLFPGLSDTYSLYGALAVKLPTADETRGLGTGEADIGAFLSLARNAGGLRLTLQGGYIKTGLMHSDGLRDVLLYGAALSSFTGRLHGYLSLDGRTPLASGARAPLEVSVGALYALSPRYFVKASSFRGLNDGGPAVGVALGIVRAF